MLDEDYSDSLSDSEWMVEAHHQYAGAYGEDRTEQAWILSPYDVWVANPHYRGEPQPHPESYNFYDDED
jgi:hypothetical protein